jgi:hypothetical protein
MKAVTIAVVSALGLLAVAAAPAHKNRTGAAAPAESRKAESVVDANGNLRVPADYRTSYQFLGSWAVAAGQVQGAKNLHVVYASPGTIEAYQRDGRFPDGSVLVKEVFQTSTQSMTTGTVSHAEKLAGWFVMVKESKDRHPGNNLWGDGWAWSWFNASDPSKTTSTNYKTDCLPCHVPAKATDLVYVQGYPALNRAQ